MKKFLLTCIAVACSLVAVAEELLIEAESFSQRGGWVLDQQFMDQMGSPYLMAHGMGIPVADATAEINIPQAGTYYVYARTYNWTSPWTDAEGPGKNKSFTSKGKKEVIQKDVDNKKKTAIKLTPNDGDTPVYFVVVNDTTLRLVNDSLQEAVSDLNYDIIQVK